MHLGRPLEIDISSHGVFPLTNGNKNKSLVARSVEVVFNQRTASLQRLCEYWHCHSTISSSIVAVTADVI